MSFSVTFAPELKQVLQESDEEDILCQKSLSEPESPPLTPSKEELQMAKYVRFNTPTKSTTFKKENVEYFVGSKAIDTLMESKWAKRSKADGMILNSREDAIHFMEQLFINKLLYRAKKVLKGRKLSKRDETPKCNRKVENSENARKRKKGKKENTDKTEEFKENPKESDVKETEEIRKKKKYKLDVHEKQIFLDSSDVYVWVYNPLSPKKKILGGILLFGVIATTLFPIWPPIVRTGVYYASLVALVFVGTIIGVAVCRSMAFIVIWVATSGKHHLWFLPNLLADVSFFESFKPWYTHDVRDGEQTKVKKEKQSDSESEDDSDAPLPDDTSAPPHKNGGDNCYDDESQEDGNNNSSSLGDDSKLNVSALSTEASQNEESASDYEVIEDGSKPRKS